MGRFTRADVFRFGGLIAFVALLGIIVWAIYPMIGKLFEPGGVDLVVQKVRNGGVGGVFILLGLQFLQIVVAFIPGEVVQIAAGMMYGPWLGAIIILVGCVISSAFIFLVVHKLGAPFVRDMIPAKWMDKLEAFEGSRKLEVLVFILFLIPGMPKDVLTYLVPLTRMEMNVFVATSNIARIPGVLMSTFAANGLMTGDYAQSIIIFAVAVGVAVAALLSYDKIIAKFTEHRAEKES